ncbi:MAG: hypothetical protein QF384_20515 [Alphaproteobacteria bacterium]|nr:hypothetical protein [Alphaproteobacteria bacterium]
MQPLCREIALQPLRGEKVVQPVWCRKSLQSLPGQRNSNQMRDTAPCLGAPVWESLCGEKGL